ncbi:hypothetical protein CMI37_11340 [Candidatus Pacearchaeota archaeon]|nr:hypothetical protein [Candidatus Pacearchaeota archaeon]
MAEFDEIKRAIREGFKEAAGAMGEGAPGGAPGGTTGPRASEAGLELIQARIDALKEEQALHESALATAESEYVRRQMAKEIADTERDIDRERVRLYETHLDLGKSITADQAAFLEQQDLIVDKERQRIRLKKQVNKLGTDMLKTMGQQMIGQGKMGKMIMSGIGGMQKFVKGAKLLKKALDAGAISAQALMGALGIGIIVFVIMLVVKLVKWIFELATATRDAAVGFQRMTGATYAMGEQMANAQKELEATGVDMDEMRQQYTSLYRETTIFTEASSAQQKQMAKTGAVLAELGVSAQDYAKGIQGAVKGLGVSLSDADNVMLEMRAHAMDIGVDVGILASQFATAAGSMAQFGKDGVKAFKDLSMISKITGMDLNSILQLTGKFDTFEDAAAMTGKLNAALGGNFVNAMDMMMETDPAKRFEMIRKSITDTGLSFDEMGYHQKKMFTEMLGFKDESELAQMMSGDMEGLAGNIGKTSKEYAAARKDAQRWQSTMDILKNTLASLAPTFSEFGKVIKDVMDEFINNEDSVAKIRDSLERLVNGLLLPLVEEQDFPKMMKDMVDSLEKVAGAMDKVAGAADTLMMVYDIIAGYVQFGFAMAELGSKLNPVTGALWVTWEAISAIIEGGDFLTILLTFWEGILDGIVDPLKRMGDGLGRIKDAIWGTSEAMNKKSSPSFLEGFALIPKLLNLARPAIDALLTPLKILGDMFDIIKEKFNAWHESFSNTWDSLKTSIPGKISEIMIGIGAAFSFEAMGNKITEGINSWKTSFSEGVTGIKSFLGIHSPSSEMEKQIGDPMRQGIMNAFGNLGPELAELAINALKIARAAIPEWAKAGQQVVGIDVGATKEVLKAATTVGLEAATTPAPAAPAAAGAGGERPYQITVNLQLDRKTLATEVIDIIGGQAFTAARG